VKFHFNQPVWRVETGSEKVRGVMTDSGFTASDIVVSDVDIHRFYSDLLPDPQRLVKIQSEERSSSALIFYWGMRGISPELDVHNIFFSGNYQEEFRQLFQTKNLFNDPTIYIYVSSKYNKTDASEDCENWFVMINAPADVGQNWPELIKLAKKNILDKLEQMMGKKVEENILCEEILSPPEIDQQTGSVKGSLYGSSSNSRYASFNRHANFRSDMKGLYFVGGSVHPGGGIPLCLSSAKIVGDLVEEQLKKHK
jgi:phytoene dehydrogenase-like protein